MLHRSKHTVQASAGLEILFKSGFDLSEVRSDKVSVLLDGVVVGFNTADDSILLIVVLFINQASEEVLEAVVNLPLLREEMLR